MKKHYLVSEEQVKRKLGIESFRNMSKEKIMDFISLIPQMNTEVAIAIINQFPAYVELAVCMIEKLYSICDKVLQSNDASHQAVMKAYQTTLETIREQLNRGDISPEQRQKDIEQMVDIANKMAELDAENKKFLKHISTACASILGPVLIVGTVILGVKAVGCDIPSLNHNRNH